MLMMIFPTLPENSFDIILVSKREYEVRLVYDQ